MIQISELITEYDLSKMDCNLQLCKARGIADPFTRISYFLSKVKVIMTKRLTHWGDRDYG